MSEYPTSPRPRKRQRTGKGKVGTDRPNLTEVNFILQAVLRFLDIVAGEDSTSETDQENGNNPLYTRVFLLILEHHRIRT
jgi:hypothetical protein